MAPCSIKGITVAKQVNLRVDPGLHERLIAAADRRGVSVNKEMNLRLAESFGATGQAPNELKTEIEEITIRLMRLMARC
jgi:hypothetical protein